MVSSAHYKQSALERDPTPQARIACCRWLVTCEDIGWPKSSMKGLENLWWEYHDDDGLSIDGEAEHG